MWGYMNIRILTNPYTSLTFRSEETWTYFSRSEIIQCICPVYITSARHRLNATYLNRLRSHHRQLMTTVFLVVEFRLKSCLIASVYARLCVSANTRRVVLRSSWRVSHVLFPPSVVSRGFTVAASRTLFLKTISCTWDDVILTRIPVHAFT